MLLFGRIPYELAARILAILLLCCFPRLCVLGAPVHFAFCPTCDMACFGPAVLPGYQRSEIPQSANLKSQVHGGLPIAKRETGFSRWQCKTTPALRQHRTDCKRARLVVGGFIRFSCPERGSGILRAFALPPSLADSIIKSP